MYISALDIYNLKNSYIWKNINRYPSPCFLNNIFEFSSVQEVTETAMI